MKKITKNKKNNSYMRLPRTLTEMPLKIFDKGLLILLALNANYYWNNENFGVIMKDFKSLYKKFGISQPTFIKHIKILEKKSYIQTVKVKNKKRIKICDMKDFQFDNSKSLNQEDKEMVNFLDKGID